jgi:tetratricopeptide (TPR) repeat protein
MNLKQCAAFALLAALLVVAGSARAEVPDEFKNLKVFPKDVGKRELVDKMKEFSGALGVRCTHCHVQKTPGDYDSIDWASDDLEPKKVARGMMAMVGTINKELLPAAGERDAKVRCMTCHRGLEDPATLDDVLLEVAAKDGTTAAVTKYKELRQEYYGSGSYDFSSESLGKVAESLAQNKGDLDAAMTIVELNIEMNPKDANSYLMKAHIQQVKGDKDGALASVTKALGLDPENNQAKWMLEELKKPK